ncbi:MAG: sugar transferase [Gammaproteobacteria bacterium]|nr:sugar transferase [Gammaproteobacteria bacterium]
MTLSKSKHLRQLLVVLDTTTTAAVYAVICAAALLLGRMDIDGWQTHMLLLPVLLVISPPLSGWAKPTLAGQSLFRIVFEQFRYSLVLFAFLAMVVFLFRMELISRAVLIAAMSINFVTMIFIRFFLRWWYFRARVETRENYTKVLVVGSGPRAGYYITRAMPNSEWGVEVIGCVDPDASRVGQVCEGTPVIGTLEDIERIVSAQVVDELVVALPRSRLNDIGTIADICAEQGIELKILADFYDMDATVQLDYQNRIPLLSFAPVLLDQNKLLVKRMMDIVLVTLALPLLVPVMAAVAIAVKVDSRGPVFFLQERVGLHKRRFRMIKFRSMYVDAEARMQEIEHLNEAQGPIFKITNDPRVTRVGRFIRKTSLDELPQLINVFVGQMSLVGPRAMSVRDVSLFDRGIQRKRFSVRPGIVCLREVSGRSALSFDRWLELDLQYIDTWTLGLDLQILLRVIPVVLRGSGAS